MPASSSQLVYSPRCRLLSVAIAQLGSDWLQVAENYPSTLIGTCSKVQLRRWRSCGIVALCDGVVGRSDGPDAVDGDWLSSRIPNLTKKFARDEIVCRNGTASFGVTSARELDYQQIVAEGTKSCGARATPYEAFSQSPCSRRCRSFLSALKIST